MPPCDSCGVRAAFVRCGQCGFLGCPSCTDPVFCPACGEPWLPRELKEAG
jgi:hypothetical protein